MGVRLAGGMTIFALALLGVGPAPGADAGEKGGPGDDLAKAVQDLGSRELGVRQKVQGAGGLLHQVGDESLAFAFPQHLAYTVLFRMYPVARVAPAPLKTQNLFLVG